MSVKKYINKPVVKEAIEYTGEGRNTDEVLDFCKGQAFINVDGRLTIRTLEGEMTVSKGDYVIKGLKGEFYPCKPDIFIETYNEVA